MRLGHREHDRTEEDQADKVRRGHHACQRVGNQPEQVHDIGHRAFQHQRSGAEEGRDDPADPERQDGFLAEQELAAAFAIIAPAENGGEAEHGEADGDDMFADPGEACIKGRNSQRSAGVTPSRLTSREDVCGIRGGRNTFRAEDARGEDHERGDRADDQRVDDRAQHGDEALVDRVLDLGGGVRNRRRALTGFVREDAACDAFLHGQHQQADRDTGAGAVEAEGPFEDHGESARDRVEVHADHNQTTDKVGDGHDRHEAAGHAGNPLDAAQNDGACGCGEDERCDERRDAVAAVQRIRDGVGLDRGACAPAGQNAQRCEQTAQPGPFRAHAVLDVVHRAADMASFVIDLTEADGEHAFGVFRGGADNCRDPHPEHRARPANGDGGRDAGNVAGPDGRREGGHQRAEWRDIAFVILVRFFEQLPECERHLDDRKQSEADCEIKACAEQEQQHRRPPHEIVYHPNNVFHKPPRLPVIYVRADTNPV